jgi:hypothetical protein
MSKLLILVSITVLLLVLVGGALAQVDAPLAFDLSWFSIDGGGGASSGGSYTLNGTIGQPDAGTMSGGAYTLAGGFWSGGSAPQPPAQYKVFLPLTTR